MTHRFRFAFCAAVLVAGCGSTDSANETLNPGLNEVLIGQTLTFAPAHLTVPVGTAVHWRNVGPFDHTVTSGLSSKAADGPGEEFDRVLGSGKEFDFTFDTVGDHPYFCRPHEPMGMKGVVTVLPADAPDAGDR